MIVRRRTVVQRVVGWRSGGWPTRRAGTWRAGLEPDSTTPPRRAGHEGVRQAGAGAATLHRAVHKLQVFFGLSYGLAAASIRLSIE